MTGTELEALRLAEGVLGVSSEGRVLRDLPGRRRVVRYGDVVVKAFAEVEREACARELAGLQALEHSGLSPSLRGSGEGWVATRWVEGSPPGSLQFEEDPMHRVLGEVITRLHEARPVGLCPWSVADRLQARLDDPPDACPSALVRSIRDLTAGWLPLLRGDVFVHGDWGTSNVLARIDDPMYVLVIIDFEDAHLGDPAEDFRWQGMVGPTSTQLSSMLAGYGRDLGPHLAERIGVGAAELCLDILGWDLSEAEKRRSHGASRATLQALVDGWRPGL
jgi:aminoglycoside phosphotransferase (APT) family kinase protein